MHTRLRRGHGPEFWDLWERFGARVYNRCLSIARDQADAEDLTTEVFLRVHDSLPSFEDRSPGSTESWLMKIATNHCLNYLKASRRRSVVLDDIDNALPNPGVPHEQAVMVRTAVGKLAGPQRMVIGLYGQGYSYGEISRLLGIGENEVKSRVQNGLRNLRKMFGLLRGGDKH